MNWSNIVKRSGPRFLKFLHFSVLTFGERDQKSHTENDYFKLLLLKVGVEATASWSVLSIYLIF